MSTTFAVPAVVQAAVQKDAQTNAQTDANLLRDHVAGHGLALHELLGRHEARLRWCLRNLGISEYDMADVWQEATLRVHRWAPGFKYECSVVTWLVTIMRRTGLNHIASQRRIAQPATTAISDWEVHVPEAFLLASSTEDVDRELRFDVRQAVQKLPEIYRTAVILRCFRGYSVNDIAAMLDVAPGTVKSRYARGRQILQRKLAVFAEADTASA